MNNREIVEDISRKAVEKFGNKISSVLMYGSSLSAHRVPNDIDIIIIFKNREKVYDISFMRDDLSNYNIKIDIQFLNLEDLNESNFSLDAHGQFFIHFLKGARPIYGTNPFLEMFPKYTDQVCSVIQKAQYYYFRAKKVQANAQSQAELEGLSFHRKKILLMLADFWLVYSGRTYNEIDKDVLCEILFHLSGKDKESDTLDILLGVKENVSWDELFSLYHKYYHLIIDKLQPKVKKESIFLGDIYTNLCSIGSTKVVIIASGCPSDYEENEVVRFLNIKGYDVISFHYSSTGRSKGHVFKRPESDLADVISYCKTKYDHIKVIGNSYGGYAALNLEEKYTSLVNNIIVVSPVINFKEVKHIETLPNYLQGDHPGWYRYNIDDFTDFLVNSGSALAVDSSKVAIIHGEDDEQIESSSIRDYELKNNIDCRMIAGAGHLSFNKLTRRYLDQLNVLL